MTDITQWEYRKYFHLCTASNLWKDDLFKELKDLKGEPYDQLRISACVLVRSVKLFAHYACDLTGPLYSGSSFLRLRHTSEMYCDSLCSWIEFERRDMDSYNEDDWRHISKEINTHVQALTRYAADFSQLLGKLCQ